MNGTLRKVCRVAAACTLAGVTGCTTLSTDPLSPPHVRRASCAMQNVCKDCEQRMSPEYQEWLTEVKHFCRDTYREFRDEYDQTNRWPEPYTTLCIHAVRQPLSIQAENARLQMLSLWEYHFESGTGKLTVMGRKRLEDIVDQADGLGHVVYVHRSPIAAETTARISEVRKELTVLVQDQTAFEVVEARATPSAISGGEAAAAMKLLTSPPKLSPSSSSGSSNSSSGSSGSSGGAGASH